MKLLYQECFEAKLGHSDVGKRSYTNSDTSPQDSHVGEVAESSRRRSPKTNYWSRLTAHETRIHRPTKRFFSALKLPERETNHILSTSTEMTKNKSLHIHSPPPSSRRRAYYLSTGVNPPLSTLLFGARLDSCSRCLVMKQQ
jgi:hypothetical protein